MNRLLLPILLLMLASCGGGSDVDAGSSDELRGNVRLDGSSTVFPISEAVAEEYGKVEPRVRVTVGVSGTGGGFKKFINGEIDITNASRPIKSSEHQALKNLSAKFIELPIAFDGLSVVVNPANDWVDYLTTDELKRIWQPDSTVQTWRDIRPNWPAEDIRLYGPGADSGTFDYFTSTIVGQEQASRPDFTASEDDNVLVQGISGDLNSLGYFGFAYYIENQDKLRVVPVDGGTGPKLPSVESISRGDYAPLSRPIFIYVKVDALEQPQIEDFVKYYLEHAANLAAEVGYVPLPDSVYSMASERVTARTNGSAYHGEVANLTASR